VCGHFVRVRVSEKLFDKHHLISYHRSMDEVQGSTTLRRGLAILIALGSEQAELSGGLGVTQLAGLLHEDKGQVSRTLRVLRSTGLVDRDVSTQNYFLGWMIYGLAARSGNRRLLHEVPSVLRSLVDEIGESAHLSVLQRREVLTVWTESPTLAIQATDWVGRTVPAWSTSSGRALLVDYDLERLTSLFGDGPFASASNGPTDVESLYKRLVEAKKIGYAIVAEEFEPELVGVAAPIRAHHGQVIAAINLSGPKYRFGARLEEAGILTQKAADQLTTLLGGDGASGTTSTK
jgi:DNA-binding IclR family transcriptional regulator